MDWLRLPGVFAACLFLPPLSACSLVPVCLITVGHGAQTALLSYVGPLLVGSGQEPALHHRKAIYCRKIPDFFFFNQKTKEKPALNKPREAGCVQ